jgi:hypothetical protein
VGKQLAQPVGVVGGATDRESISIVGWRPLKTECNTRSEYATGNPGAVTASECRVEWPSGSGG